MINSRVMTLKENQYVIRVFDSITEDITLTFQSYESTIAKIDGDYDLTIYKDYDYSKTTSKYLKEFLSNNYWINQKEYFKLIDNGISSKIAIEKLLKQGKIIKGF